MAKHIHIHIHKRTQDAKPFTHAELEDLANRMACALEELMGWGKGKDDFREEDHPRRDDGRFGTGGGGAEPAALKPTTVKATSAKAGLHELLSTGHPFSKAELITILGLSEKRFSDYMVMVKNPKYAGKEGALTIERTAAGEYIVQRQKASGASAAPAAAPVLPKPAEAPKAPVKAVPAPTQVSGLSSHQKILADTGNDKRFHKVPVPVLKQAFNDKYGITLVHTDGYTEKKKKIDSLKKQHIEVQRTRAQSHVSRDRDEYQKHTDKLRSLEAEMGVLRRELHSGSGSALERHSAHTTVDLDAGGARVKQQLTAMHHTALALDHLEKMGVPVKTLMKKHGVKFLPGTPRSTTSRGHATPGEFALNGKCCTDETSHEQTRRRSKERLQNGMGLWAVSANPDFTVSEATQATAVHELAHAIGLRHDATGRTSPAKLQQLFHTLEANGVFNTPETEGAAPAQRARVWIRKNISEYVTSHWVETDAELAATVFSREYKPGTLPKELEDHAHQLLERKAG